MARRCYGQLQLLPRLGPIPLEPVLLPLPGQLEAGSWLVDCLAQTYEGQAQGPWDFWLSRSAPSLTLRPRRTGDRLTLPGRLGKSVKKWMIQEKLPRFQRDSVPVFECGGSIAAVAGLGPDRAFLPQKGQEAWHIRVTAAE